METVAGHVDEDMLWTKTFEPKGTGELMEEEATCQSMKTG